MPGIRALALVFMLGFAAVAASQPALVDAGGRKVRLLQDGTGPLVVFENGFGATLEEWRAVIPEVAKFARVIAYDRAGVGQSDPVSSERSYATLASELHALLQQQKAGPPYVLVGHSYGGGLARVYAHMFPGDVSGIVFVDPISEVAIMTDPEKGKHIAEQEAAIRDAPAGIRAEFAWMKKDFETDFRELKKSGNPNVPMALIVATIDRPPGWRSTLMQQYGSWLIGRDDSLIVVTPNSGHNVPSEDPQLVVSAIRSILFPNPVMSIEKALTAGGFNAAVTRFRQVQATYPKGDITPRVLNRLGYTLVRREDTANAVKIFALNTEMYPEDWNAWDSLGEAYASAGDKARALDAYRKSLALNPQNGNATHMIERLEGASR